MSENIKELRERIVKIFGGRDFLVESIINVKFWVKSLFGFCLR